MFGTAIDLGKSIDPIEYGVSVFISHDPVALWNVMKSLTNLVRELGRWWDPVLMTVFILIGKLAYWFVSGIIS